MQAIVLVGGRGTRLLPLTDSLPKPLLPIALRPLLGHVIERLAEAGVDEVVLSLGYRPDDFVEQFPGGEWRNVRLRYAVEPEPLGTGGGIRYAAELAGVDDTFFVVNGDVIASGSLRPLLECHRDRGALATVALTEVADPSAFGIVDSADDGRVRAFVEKPAQGTAPSNLANVGAYVLEAATLASFPDGASSIERDVFPVLAGAGTLYSAVIPGTWVDAGTLDGYLTANLGALDRDSRVLVDPSAAIAPDVTLDRVVLGPSVTVGQGAVVRDAVVMENVRIGPGAVIEHSVIGAGAEIGAHVQMRDRLVAFGAVVVGDEPARSGRAA